MGASQSHLSCGAALLPPALLLAWKHRGWSGPLGLKELRFRSEVPLCCSVRSVSANSFRLSMRRLLMEYVCIRISVHYPGWKQRTVDLSECYPEGELTASSGSQGGADDPGKSSCSWKNKTTKQNLDSSRLFLKQEVLGLASLNPWVITGEMGLWTCRRRKEQSSRTPRKFYDWRGKGEGTASKPFN